MLTYDFTNATKPLYEYLYSLIKADIKNGILATNEKMPSKRNLAKNLGVSAITVENAYNQLIDEGYLRAEAKKGYYVEKLYHFPSEGQSINNQKREEAGKPEYFFDFSSNHTEEESFPFSIWAKLMRNNISLKEKELLSVSPVGGVYELRQAISEHLNSFRGMQVNPRQIIVGAGTEYLYELLIKLLGREKLYSVENPGYKKVKQIYEANGVPCITTDIDNEGIKVDKLKEGGAQIAHISPTHHYPTGITMSKRRREEILEWAGDTDKYIIEDDYDSEFRTKGRPLPPLFTMDSKERVIYINTFSKSLTATIRIGYMVLPKHLSEKLYKEFSFYSCTVSTFEQYTLADFIGKGYFEKHINRCRLRYTRKRTESMAIIRSILSDKQCEIRENDSGLHFLLRINTNLDDEALRHRLAERKIRLEAISSFYLDGEKRNQHSFIFNYSNIKIERLAEALQVVKEEITKGEIH